MNTFRDAAACSVRAMAAALVIACALLCAGDTHAAGEDVPWPTRGWVRSTPEEQGVDSAKLAALLEHVAGEDLALHSLLVIRHGHLVSETYFAPYHRDALQAVASCTKSVTSAVVGVAIARGAISGVDRKVLSWFPELPGAAADPRRAQLTLEHLLTMTTGMAWHEGSYDARSPDRGMFASRDWERHVLEVPMERPPGEHFAYNTGASQLLSAIVQRATGKPAAELAREALFEPMGIPEYGWARSPGGAHSGGVGLALSPESLAKLGLLYLHEGRWEDRQLLPAAWVRASTRAHVGEGRAPVFTAGEPSYGYQWWIWPWGYAAQGWGGQRLFVAPGEDLVVVLTAGLPQSDLGIPVRLFESFILSAVSPKPLPPNPAALERLRALSRALESPAPGPVSPLPARAAEVSGRRYAFSKNSERLRSVRLQFGEGAAARVEFEMEGLPALSAPVGLDGTFRRAASPVVGEVGARGRWLDAETFELVWQPLRWPGSQTYLFRFEGDRVRVSWEESGRLSGGSAVGRR